MVAVVVSLVPPVRSRIEECLVVVVVVVGPLLCTRVTFPPWTVGVNVDDDS